jgi:hypothetical protein
MPRTVSIHVNARLHRLLLMNDAALDMQCRYWEFVESHSAHLCLPAAPLDAVIEFSWACLCAFMFCFPLHCCS